ncbi:MAG: hypothetical protein H7A25_13815 [Leptospiraceae bacterium]|nr:hypothetical protein [Leptospiraceae bacterium]
MSRNYYICSIGQPNQGYDDENLRRCIINNCFVLHENAKQKGCIHEIKPDDILILKYKHEFIGYGRSTSSLKQIGEGWSYQVDVNMWEIIFINMEFKMHNKKVQHMML